jgi:hypothetical protein
MNPIIAAQEKREPVFGIAHSTPDPFAIGRLTRSSSSDPSAMR